MRPLFKTTIVIWSDFDPRGLELDELARDAVSGDSYCSRQSCERVEDVAGDKDWDGSEFFDEAHDLDDICSNCGAVLPYHEEGCAKDPDN